MILSISFRFVLILKMVKRVHTVSLAISFFLDIHQQRMSFHCVPPAITGKGLNPRQYELPVFEDEHLRDRKNKTRKSFVGKYTLYM